MKEVANGTEVTFANDSDTYAVLRKNKDNWGNVIGLRVVSKSGTEYDVVEHNGDVCLTDGAVSVPKPVGELSELGEAEWFDYKTGGYVVA